MNTDQLTNFAMRGFGNDRKQANQFLEWLVNRQFGQQRAERQKKWNEFTQEMLWKKIKDSDYSKTSSIQSLMDVVDSRQFPFLPLGWGILHGFQVHPKLYRPMPSSCVLEPEPHKWLELEDDGFEELPLSVLGVNLNVEPITPQFQARSVHGPTGHEKDGYGRTRRRPDFSDDSQSLGGP